MNTRERIRAYLVQHLFGPRGGPTEEVAGRVHLQYMLGILYAQGTTVASLEVNEAIEEEDSDVATPSDEDQSDAANKYFHDGFSRLPSAAGLSVCVEAGCGLRIEVSAGVYRRPGTGKESGGPKSEAWRREPVSASVTVPFGRGGNHAVFDGRASLRVLFRALANGHAIATTTLVNEQVKSKPNEQDASKDLFQVAMQCTPERGCFAPYPSTEINGGTQDELEVAFELRDFRPFAVGHGASVTWEADAAGARSVALEFLPAQYVGRPIFDDVKIGDKSFSGQEVFSLAYLADPGQMRQEVIDGLSALVDFYAAWRKSLDLNEVPEEFHSVAGERLDRVDEAIARMRAGIRSIAARDQVYEAFRLANYAMLMQMVHAKLRRAGPYDRNQAPHPDVDYFDEVAYRWRPFQLAFLLLVLQSLVDEDDKWHDLVDVIWFSTGGGKTEAYLLVAAFTLIYRRLAFGEEGCGTAIINRYTYRFLTADQFDRTAGLACALERVRADHDALGSIPFTVGLWVGGQLTPNSFRDAEDKFSELVDSIGEPDAKNAFQIETCPDCGTRLFPRQRERDEEGNDDLSAYGFRAGAHTFSCRCPSEGCFFHASLPVSMVDDVLYQRPPSFLIGTIDKFAMLPWRSEAGAFLGVGTDYRPPSLIIQDELHLISGPLGTLAGIYEAAIETTIREYNGGRGPKIIASTATIRNASAQCRRLYGRPARVFPSPGLLPSDSFFARVDDAIDRSRLYVGVMGQGVTNTIAVYWSVAALLQAVRECDMTPAERDAYWTLLAYHNSKRELGRTRNAVSDEISDRIKVYCEAEDRQRQLGEPLEISSNAVESVSTARALLSRPHSDAEPAIDVVPCTNMISVGIDIDRLGLMFVNGQPKLTSEYIQATSRVGRKSVPGLVLTCLSPSKPRDRSHYESFRYFHSVMSAYVEPTSVTPGSMPACERAIHAGLVMIVRFAGGLADNSDANDFNSGDIEIERVTRSFEQRLVSAYEPGAFEARTIATVLRKRISEWESWCDPRNKLVYKAMDKNSRGVMYVFGKPRKAIGWPTLQSMRHVDSDVELGVL